MVQLNEIRGIIILLHPDKHHFPFRSFELIQSLVQHSTLAFANSLLREKLEITVITDYLSGLYTRKYLDEQVSIELNKGEAGTFLLVDIDDFKKVNDTFGHEIGDNIIIQVADVLKGSTGDNDIAARWGGEELAVYMPGAPLNEGLRVAEKLVKEIKTITHPTVTVSIGVSSWDKTNTSMPDSLFQRADKALYKAKHAGKNRVSTL